jgi:hypothetical protein
MFGATLDSLLRAARNFAQRALFNACAPPGTDD